MITITAQNFKPIDAFVTSDKGTAYQNGCILDKYKVTIDISICKFISDARLNIKASDKTITLYNNIDFRTFTEADINFVVGEKIVIPSSASNTGTYTITAVTDRVITVAESLTDELVQNSYIYVDASNCKVTDLEFYYNLFPANSYASNDNLLSLTDKGGFQKYTATGLDASDTSTVHYLNVGTDSFAWVSDNLTGVVSNSTIKGLGISGYKQSFRIVHQYEIAPFFLKEQYWNFANRIAPDMFKGENCLAYLLKINAKYAPVAQVIPNSLSITSAYGKTAWFNQNVFKTRPEYAFNSITYKDHATGDSLDRIDFTKVCEVEIKITSASGLFVSNADTGSRLVINHLFCPLNESEYENTQYTQRQNYVQDRLIIWPGKVSAVNGEYYGTVLQVMKTCTSTRVDAYNVTINFLVDYSTQLKAGFATLDASNRNYAFSVTTQNVANTTDDENIDRVNILCDFQNLDYDQRNSSLINLVDYVRAYSYPDMGYAPTNTISNFEGTPVFVEVPFQVNVDGISPTIKSAGIQIVATKANANDFILEQKIFNPQFVCKSSGAQNINIAETKNYKSFQNTPYGQSSLVADSTYNDTHKKGYVLRHGFTLRYEDWIQILTTDCPDIVSDNANLTQRWSDIQSWSLYARFTADITDDSGYTTSFYAQIPITIQKAGTNPSSGPVYATDTFIIDKNTNILLDSLKPDGSAQLVTIYTISPTSVSGESLGSTSDGVLTYNKTLAHKKDQPATLILTVGTETYTDNGDGTLTGSAGGAGTINYDTGAVSVTSTSNPYPGAISANYSYYKDLGNYPCAYYYADIKTQNGGVNQRRYASSDNPSEADSPFVAPPAAVDATASYAQGGVRVDMYGNNIVVARTNYTGTVSTFGADPCAGVTIHASGGLHLPPNAGPTTERDFADGTPHLWPDLTPALF